jgi:hypothetical protein
MTYEVTEVTRTVFVCDGVEDDMRARGVKAFDGTVL